jgi:hypothetical protein
MEDISKPKTRVKDGINVQFRVSRSDFENFNALAKHFFEINAIRKPTVAALAKASLYKICQEYMSLYLREQAALLQQQYQQEQQNQTKIEDDIEWI